jgi:hypothetical protein
MLLTALIGFPLSYVLASWFGVVGLIFATLVAELPSLGIALFWVRKNYGLTIDWVSSGKILFSSALAGAITYVAVSSVGLASWVNLVMGVVVFAVLFMFVSLLVRVLGRGDLVSLREMTKSLGFLHRFFVLLFDFYERLMTLLRLG